MMLAQADIQNLPAGWLKYMITFLIVSVVLTALVVGAVVSTLQYFQSKRAVAETQTREISPQPLIVAMQKEFASKHEFDAHVARNDEDHKGIFSKIGGVERGAASSLEQKVEVVRKDLIHVGNQVAGLKAQTDLQNQQLARMDAKLDRIAEK